MIRYSSLLLLALPVMYLVACTPARKLNYFNNIPDSTIVHLPPVIPEERIVVPGDVLNISFSAKAPEAATAFNKQVNNAMLTGSPSSRSSLPAPMPGYTVDLQGNIELPVLGKIKVMGNTIRQLKATLSGLVDPYLKDPFVEISFGSFPVTVIGEVRAPGMYNLNLQKNTIFDALAAAGDLPYSGKKFKVQLYRDYNGDRTITNIDLTDKAFLVNKEIFNMRPYDVIIVQTRKGSVFKEDFSVLASVVTLVLSVVTLGITVTK
ncbi:polysaccharide biosynthesis/export family protein [Pseudoflavitalea rhizosphaerae]|uniref:polysaccharide biosynthesis/export family protein n=1 Tax=Pseudoflavitalea rhizosphaerae TaxID=1884793 RepID=UPI000F8E2246|nr:polysaccharide biosynthesis/export family protein [Pseudoflavitalea rhizosphaerae]